MGRGEESEQLTRGVQERRDEMSTVCMCVTRLTVR